MTPILYYFGFDTLFAHGFLGSKKLFFYNIPSLGYVTEFQRMSNHTLVTLFPSSKRFPPYFRSITMFIIHHRQLRREPQMHRL